MRGFAVVSITVVKNKIIVVSQSPDVGNKIYPSLFTNPNPMVWFEI